MGSLFTNLVQKVVISRKWTENGPMLDRERTDEVAEKSARMSTVWAMMWVKLVNLVNFVMHFLKWTKWTKWTEQIFEESAESAKSAKSIFATFATLASANFVGKASCESTVRYREWSRISLIKPLLNPYLTLTRFRLSLGSNLSRLCLASLICLCMLTVGVGNVWGDALKTSDLDFGTPDVDVTFESLSTITESATSTAQTIGSLSGFTPFDKAYIGSTGNGAQSMAIAGSSGAMTSNHMAFVFTNNSIATTFDHDFEDKGAFSFKVLKASTVNIGIYTANAYSTGSTVFSHAAASVFLQCTSSEIKISAGRTSGTPNKWQSVSTSLPSDDVLEIHVIYNNTSSDDTYGDDITIPAYRAHVFINGDAVMDDDVPMAFYLNGNSLASFRICYTGSATAKIDDIKIYDALPGSGKSLSSIEIKTDATKTAYVAGEDFDPAGMVITATYSDNSTEDIDYDTNSAKFSFSPSTNLSAGTTSVTVTYGGQTCSQTIAVYNVTISMVGADDESTPLTGAGIPSAPTRTGASINADNTTLYGFKKWVISNASLGSAATTKSNTITNPTATITLKAVYNSPRTVTWLVDGNPWTPYTTKGTGVDGTAAVQHGKAWSTLTLPTDPTPSDGCGQKFIGWVAAPIAGSLDKDDDAAAISALDIMTNDNKGSKTGGGHNINSNITFYAVFADYAE